MERMNALGVSLRNEISLHQVDVMPGMRSK